MRELSVSEPKPSTVDALPDSPKMNGSLSSSLPEYNGYGSGMLRASLNLPCAISCNVAVLNWVLNAEQLKAK